MSGSDLRPEAAEHRQRYIAVCSDGEVFAGSRDEELHPRTNVLRAGMGSLSAYAIYSHIADVIRGNCEYRVPLTFTRNLTAVCDAIHKSADTDEVVRLSVEDWNKPL